ncbi:alpha/beta fold hydrolase [Chthonomonas calidirosea]|uniref:alpha/beta fold hydrolase n=1 Tax=Chthonomonas calidirosea TaxID=454171 RepID=UPI0012E3B238|nr:alpha/beta hydrolase [Chthonomonas calidirosea]
MYYLPVNNFMVQAQSFLPTWHRGISHYQVKLGIVMGLLGLHLFPAKVCWAEEGYFNSDGVQIHYVQAGSGQAVVLIHGWMASAKMWGTEQRGNSIFWSLSKNFHVIAMDCRGHGLSDKPHDPKAYGCAMPLDVVRLLDHLHIQQAYLIGYSMGAILTGKIVASYPQRVLGAIFGGGAPVVRWGPEDLKQNDAFLEKWQKDRGLQELSALLFGVPDRTALVMANQSLREITVKESELRRFKGPILFLYGDRDSEATRHYVEAARQAFGHGDIRVVPGADHFSTPMKPEFLRMILSFLDRVETPSKDRNY